MNWMERLRGPIDADSLLAFDPAGSGGYALDHILERRLAGRGQGGYETRNAPDIVEFREIWAVIAYICDASLGLNNFLFLLVPLRNLLRIYNFLIYSFIF